MKRRLALLCFWLPEKGQQGHRRWTDVFARCAVQLTDDPAEQAKLRAASFIVATLDCDGSLNVVGR